LLSTNLQDFAETPRHEKDNSVIPTHAPAFDLIAEEVADVNPDLIARNSIGEPESVHYEW
jgi:hypothetical protein